MVDFVDLHFANMLSSRLERFRIKSTNPCHINFRCPICGDSQKSKQKARGWLLEKNNTLHFYCHNCGASQQFQTFLKNQDPLLYNDYIAEKFLKDSKKDKIVIPEKEKIIKPKFVKSPLSDLKKISQLRHDHPAKEYIEKRLIPSNQHYRIYYAPKFRTWTNTLIPNKFPDIKKDEPRIVLPFFDENGDMFGFSARGFDPNGIRYITIMLSDHPKIFGLDKVDFEKQYFVVEGAFDSFFLSNAVAMAGADRAGIKSLKNLSNAVFVFDAEPRNIEISKHMLKIIRSGYSICIWPHNVPGKDINEMIMNGKTDVEETIKNNVYRGLEAELQLSSWRKSYEKC